MAQINVDDAGLNELRTALETAGEEYKNNLSKLTNLMNEITNGVIEGDPATDLLNKFTAKQDTFNALANTIDEAEEYMGMQTTKFSGMLDSLSSGMR